MRRFDYIPADSQAGVVVYDGKFVFSHHATNPACGKLMNVFDMVRIHKFGELDAKCSEDTDVTKLPSFKAITMIHAENRRLGQGGAGYFSPLWQTAHLPENLRTSGTKQRGVLVSCPSCPLVP